MLTTEQKTLYAQLLYNYSIVNIYNWNGNVTIRLAEDNITIEEDDLWEFIDYLNLSIIRSEELENNLIILEQVNPLI